MPGAKGWDSLLTMDWTPCLRPTFGDLFNPRCGKSANQLTLEQSGNDFAMTLHMRDKNFPEFDVTTPKTGTLATYRLDVEVQWPDPEASQKARSYAAVLTETRRNVNRGRILALLPSLEWRVLDASRLTRGFDESASLESGQESGHIGSKLQETASVTVIRYRGQLHFCINGWQVCQIPIDGKGNFGFLLFCEDYAPGTVRFRNPLIATPTITGGR